MHVFSSKYFRATRFYDCWSFFNVLFARSIRKTTSLRNNDTNYDCITCINLFLLVGTVVDRFDRQRICTVSNICCSLCNIGILISLYYGMIILVFLFLFLENACIQFFSPSEQSMIQGVVESDQYGAAAGINQMVNSLYALFGVGIATMVYWTFGVYGSILVNTLTFILSGILIQTISIPEKFVCQMVEQNGKKLI